MNNYKTIFLLIIFIALFSFLSAQNKNVVETKIKVEGNCDQCKERIENALDVKGVKFVDWNSKTKILELAYIPKKITIDEIHAIIAKAGHDTEKVKATDKDYQSLSDCCLYRDKSCTKK